MEEYDPYELYNKHQDEVAKYNVAKRNMPDTVERIEKKLDELTKLVKLAIPPETLAAIGAVEYQIRNFNKEEGKK